MQSNLFFSLEQVIERQPIIVTPDFSLAKALDLMHQRSSSCSVDSSEEIERSNSSCVLIVENDRLQGIFTERDLVKLIAAKTDLKRVEIAQVMSRDVIALTYTGSEDVFSALNLLRQNRIRHLPVVDKEKKLLGLTTAKNLRQKLQPVNMMKWRKVAEVMQTEVIHAHPNDSVRYIAKLMANSNISCVAIGELEANTDLVRPLGIITERDIVQFQNLNLDLEQPARNWMSAPLFLVSCDDTLWKVHQQMQQRHVRRLLVGGEKGELKGIITQTSLLQVFDTAEMYGVIESLQQQVCCLELAQTRLLEKRQIELEREVKERTSALDYSYQRLQQEANLRQQNEQRFDSILNSLKDVVWSIEPHTHKVLYINQAAEDIYNCPIAEFYSNPHLWLEVIHPEYKDRVSNSIQNILETEFDEMEYPIILSDGKVRWLYNRFQIIKDKEGIPLRIDGITNDISDRKRRENIIKDIASGISVEVGENFFNSLVEFLSKTLQVNFAFISKLTDSESNKAKTITVYAKGKNIDNFEYSLADTPCGDAIEQGLCIYPEAVRQVFPNIRYFNAMEAESYGGMPIYDDAGNVLGLIAVVDSKPFIDITLIEEVLKIFAIRVSTELERQKAEVTLQQSEQKFRAIFDHTFQFIGLLEPDGKIMEANRTSLEFVGLTPNDVKGQLFWNTPWWSKSLKAQKLLKQGISRAAKGEFVRFEVEHPGTENRLVTVDFSLTPIKDETGKVVMLIPEGRDISDYKLAEAKIRQQAALLDVATDAIMVRNLDNTILFWNQGAEKLYGWEKTEILTKDVNQLLYQRLTEKLNEIQQTILDKGEWQGELNQVTKTGKDIVVKSRWSLVKDEAGSPQSILVVNTDITEQKQLEAQFLRTQRLESLGTLAGGIAHDLNNILAPILGFSKLIPIKLPDVDEQIKSFFKIMETNAYRGTALVKQILTFAQGLEGERGIIQIRHLIDEIKQIITETFPKSIELEISVSKNLYTVNGDINQLHQVLMNLCVNARDAMVNGGKLKIQAENIIVGREYARLHLDATEGSYLVITVIDTGVGIAPEIIDRIFEPFFTTKEIGSGTGLGLSTVIGIVKSHGGFIDLVSNTKGEQQGTQIKVFLPASETATLATEETETLPQGNGELILVVDDETAILELTKATLETYNYKILIAKNGIDAIAIFAQNQQAIDLVMIDIMMPSMDGKTAIRTLKKIDPEVKIIAMSGLISSREIIKEINSNISAFLTKPYSNEYLLNTIHKSIKNV